MEHTSDTVYEGKMIGETSYPQRATQYTELDLGIAKIDFYDAQNRVVHEVKKSNKVEEAHLAQVKYYLYLLKQIGISDATAIIEYPKLRSRQEVAALTDEDIQTIEKTLADIQAIVQQDACPPRIKKTFCRSCSYFDFCWSKEGEWANE